MIPYVWLLDFIESIYEWNRIAWNEWSFNKHLEISMLSEENAELIIWVKNNDIKEMQDWWADHFVVWVWTQYKKWISAEDTYKTLINIMQSNFSKFTEVGWELKCIKDETWKIMKDKNYVKPNLSHLDKYIN